MASRTSRLLALYDQVPKMQCKGLCGKFCCTVPMTPLELYRLTGGHPLPVRQDDPIRCPLWDEAEGCTRYEDRPLIRRLWGTTPELTCPHGCLPEAMLTEPQSAALIHAALEISSPGVMIVDPEELREVMEASA